MLEAKLDYNDANHMKKFSIVLLTVLAGFAIGLAAVIRRFSSPKVIFEHPHQGPARPGISNRVFESGGRRRGFWLYIPRSYHSETPIPLVMSLHGFASSASGQQYLSRWDKLAEKEGFCVVYPQGTGSPLRWNSSVDFGAQQVDDVAFIRDLLVELNHLLNIDQEHIYVNGMSNGGAMTARLAWEMQAVFAAAGIVSGPPVTLPECQNPKQPIPLIAFYGTADPLVKYEGGPVTESLVTCLAQIPAKKLAFPPIRPWIHIWVKRNGCNPEPEPWYQNRDVVGIRFSGQDKACEIIFYTILGGGHTWPGGFPTFVGRTTHTIDASTEMWEFFKRHSLSKN